MRSLRLLACLAVLWPRPTAAQAPALVPAQAAVPPSRWLVELRERTFDLTPLRAAVEARLPAAAGQAVVDDLERRVRADQEPFARAAATLGFRVVRQWWIVNGCSVEGPEHEVGRLRALPHVRRVERDEAVPAALTTATNAFNHNADKLQALGIRGNLATVVAVMDSGADEDMGGSGRPHRLYFVDGDPSNKSGGGIGGSRLVKNQRLGALSADDVHGHGTYVASVCAGAAWGIPAADHGHAYGAQIASYSIADCLMNGLPYTYFSTMTSAWQAIATDRARGLNIVAANNSFSAPADPLHFVQQALDTTALVADVLISVSAGNDGPNPATARQGCLNGLAVGAVLPDSHQVVSWSSRGPMSVDATRTFPDLAACTYSNVAVPDCESTYLRFRGTSNAAPQVCGAATLLRAEVPTLRADETKAILLASTLDIAAQNPSLDRNAFGMGLLRDDVAMDTAKNPAWHGRGTVQTTAPVWTFPFPVAAGESYAVAIAWHRQNTASMGWSNLDLRVLDGSTVVASSSSPRNVYERAAFRATRTGTYVAEVSALTLEAASQELGIAVARALSPAPLAGTYASYGKPCKGSQPDAGPVCVAANPSASPEQLVQPLGGVEWELAFERTAPATPITVTGFETFTRQEHAATRRTMLLLADAQGRPLDPPVRTGTQWVGIQPAWHRAELAPHPIAAGTRFFVGIQGLAPGMSWLGLTTGTELVTYYQRKPCDTAWVGPFTLYAGIKVDCGAGVPGAEPLLASDGVPMLGSTFRANLRLAKSHTAALLFTGTSRTTWGALALPFDLGPFGAPGCALLAAGDILVGTAVDGLGEASIPFAVPSHGALLGGRFYQQHMVLDPLANQLGLAFTNGGEGRIGGR